MLDAVRVRGPHIMQRVGRIAGQRSRPAASQTSRSRPTVSCSASPTAASAPACMAAPTAVKFGSLKGVLFDIDGTLTNSDPLHFKAFQDILVELGYDGGKPIDEHFFRLHISGRHNPEIAADLFPDWPEERRTQFYMDKEERFRLMAGSVLKPLEGLPEFLGWVTARGLRKGAVTNAPRANTLMMLEALHLDQYFEVVVLGEECVRAKPFPDPYLEGMRLLGLSGAETLVVEDSPAGVRAAVAAGIPVIGLTTGQSPEALRAAGACHVCSDFTEVLDMIKQQQAM